jgi:dephospho-CoA kinase
MPEQNLERNPMRPFGLTGNIACGKSTVASLLAKFSSVKIVDCDQIAKEILADPKHLESIVKIIGSEAFTGNNPNFIFIRETIFSSSEKRKRLEKFVHPLVWKKVDEIISRVPPDTIQIVESAIIFETDSVNKFRAIIVAYCSDTEQERRLREERNMNPEDIVRIKRNQYAQTGKRLRADYTIDTQCSFVKLRDRVKNLYLMLK